MFISISFCIHMSDLVLVVCLEAVHFFNKLVIYLAIASRRISGLLMFKSWFLAVHVADGNE